MTSEPSQTPADIPLEGSMETTAFPAPGAATGPMSSGPMSSGQMKTTVGPPPAEAISPTATTQVMPHDRPPTIPDVTLDVALGKGGMGTVFKGRQITLDRLVAVKAIHPQLAKDRSFVERFEREAKVLAKLSHANIVTCYAAGTCRETGQHYLVMEFVEGEDLLKRVRKDGPLGERDALVIARQVAEGLEHALDSGIIHRDVKPENILLKPVPGRAATSIGVQAKIVDLGLAAMARPDKESLRLTEAGTTLGTPLTMAPEQAEAPDSIDHRVDIYALGCTLFFALTGRFPHEGATIAQVLSKKLRDETPDPRSLRPDLGESTARLILRMMSFDAAKRPATYEELVSLLEHEVARFPSLSTARLASAKSIEAAKTPVPPPPGKEPVPPPRRGAPLALVGVLVLGAAGAVGLLSHKGPPPPTPPPSLPVTPPVVPTPPPPTTPATATPPPPPLTATPSATPPEVAWKKIVHVFDDLDASRFMKLDRQPASAWKKPGDEDDFADNACHVLPGESTLAWYTGPVDASLRIEGLVTLYDLTGTAGVRLDFGSSAIDVLVDSIGHFKAGIDDEKTFQSVWKVRMKPTAAPTLSTPLAYIDYDGAKGRRQRLAVVVSGGTIWARLDEMKKTTWVSTPAPGPLARVGLYAAGAEVGFKGVLVETAHE